MSISDIVNKAPIVLNFISNKMVHAELKGRNILPFYHTVGNHAMPHINSLYTVKTEAQFIEDLEYFEKQFSFCSYKDLIANKKSNTPQVLLSFDDGFRECYDIVRPLLLAKGIPAIFFINSGFLKNDVLMYRCKVSYILNTLPAESFVPIKITLDGKSIHLKTYQDFVSSLLNIKHQEEEVLDDIIDAFNLPIDQWLLEYKPYMDENHIKALHADGFTIGAHSHSHPQFEALDEEGQWMEIEKSVDKVNEITGGQQCPFSFPFNDLGVFQSVFDRIAKSEKIGYTFGVSGLKTDSINNHVHRIAMEDCTLTSEERLKSEVLSHKIRKVIGKQKVSRW